MRATLPAAPQASEPPAQQRARLAFGLIVAVWVLGLVGHFTSLAEWPALWIYGIGAIGLVYYHCWRYNAWRDLGITQRNLGAALAWGCGIGGGLMLMDVVNTYLYYRGGGAPMAQMEQILVGQGLLVLFPLLIIAEEWFWRGMVFTVLLERGMNKHLVVLAVTVLHMLNHFAVAPVGWFERALLALMALPLGIIGGYLVLRTRNVWAGVALHGLTMVSMIADIFIIPHLV